MLSVRKAMKKEKCDRIEVWESIALGKVIRKDFSKRVTFELRFK